MKELNASQQDIADIWKVRLCINKHIILEIYVYIVR